MAYSKDVVSRARAALAAKKADRESLSQQRLSEAYAKVPRIRQIDSMLRQSMVLAARNAFLQGSDGKAAMEKIKEENLTLQQEKEALVNYHFGPGWLLEGPECPKCGDNGYVGSTMCECLLELCRQEQKKEVAMLASNEQHFDNFRLDYYPNTASSKTGFTPRAIMSRILETTKKYAQSFSPASGNLLFNGGTGLGKTFLSGCIARQVADMGYSVAYETAGHLMQKLEKQRFAPDAESYQQVQKVMDADLLIIDDLGTEMPGNFVTAALYSLLNDRLLAGKPMVVSTNLSIEEIGQRYSPQIASRLRGSFQLLPFVGQDIRVMKNRGL